MNKEELKNKMENLNEKMKDVGAKIKDATDTVILTGIEAKDTLDEKVEDAKSNLESAKEQCRIISEKSKSKVSSELLKAQMNFQVAKETIEDKKEARSKERLSKYIDDELEYAEQCVAFSLVAAEEAKLAFLEAVEAQKEYDEKYGDEE